MVRNPGRMLSTVLLALIGIWLYMIVGVHFFRDTIQLGELGTEEVWCEGLLACYGYYLLYGTDNPPTFENISWSRLLYSFSYNFFIMWVIIAIVSGIIIDNLGELRDLRSRIADDLESRCFVCNIARAVFEDIREDGFSEHVQSQHNMWDYMSFFLYLDSKDEFELTPQEKFVKDKLNSRKEDRSWHEFFPIREALCLRRTERMRNVLVTSFTDMASRVDVLEECLMARMDSHAAELQAMVKEMVAAARAKEAARAE